MKLLVDEEPSTSRLFHEPVDRPVVVSADVLDLSASRGQESVSSVE